MKQPTDTEMLDWLEKQDYAEILKYINGWMSIQTNQPMPIRRKTLREAITEAMEMER